MKTTSAIPDVTEYFDLCHYLSDYYTFRKTNDPNFSYQTWADELGFVDRSFLRMIVSGRRSLSDNNKLLFLEKIPFDDIQKKYFSHMVSMKSSVDLNLKSYHSRQMINLLRLKNEMIITEPRRDFLSHPKIPVLYVLLGHEDIEGNIENLSRVLQEPLEQVQNWIEILKNLDMIEIKPDSKSWKTKKKNFEIPDKVGDDVVRTFHQMILNHAIKAQSLPRHQRKYRSLIVALDENQLEKVWKKFSEFAIEVLAENSDGPLADRKLFHINFNLVPAVIPHTDIKIAGPPLAL